MNPLLESSTLKSETEIFQDIIKCQKCQTSENLCKSHAEAVKTILMKNAKNEIDKLTLENND
jgi:hypothetical protein